MAYQLVNNLRYGQVSSKMAGRFDLDMYSQGAKLVENFICMRQGGITRRPPEKFLAEVSTDTERITSIILDKSTAVCICLSVAGFTAYSYTMTEDGKFTLNLLQELTAWPEGYTPTAQNLQDMCFAQHYTYLYATCSELRLGRFNYTNLVSFEVCTVMTNMDEIKDEEGESSAERKKKEEARKAIKAAGFNEDTLMKDDSFSKGLHYPSGCAIVSDRLLLFGTKGEKDTVWWSRVLGTSQVLEDEEDSLLDFIQYDTVETTTQQIKDISQVKKTKKLDTNGNYLYHTEEIGGSSVQSSVYKTADSENENFDGSAENKLYQCVKRSGDTLPSDYTVGAVYVFEDSAYQTPYKPSGRASNKLTDLVYQTDYWRWPYWEYDMSQSENFIEETTESDYVATSTTAMKMQLASGRMDKILWATVLDNVYIGTDTSVWALPTSINALSQSAQRVSSHALYDTPSSTLGGTVIYAGKGGKIRGLSGGDSISDSELTLTSDGIISSDVKEMVELSSPEPTLYVLLNDGSMRTLTIDSEFGLQGWATWSFSFKVSSIAKIEDGSNERLLLLCKDDSTRWIGYLDNDEIENFTDTDKNGEIEYVSTLTMHRMDSYSDSGATLGVRKSIRNIVFRPMESGRAIVGYSDRDMETVPKALGSSDYKMAVGGGSVNELCFSVKSYKAEPLTLLAVAYEATVNQ